MRHLKSYISLTVALLFLILMCPIFAEVTSVPLSPPQAKGIWQSMNQEQQATIKTKLTLKPC